MADATASANETPTASPTALYVRVGLVMAAWTAVHLLVVASIAHGATPGGWWPYLGAFAALMGGVVILLGSFAEHAYPGKWTRLLVMRPFWYAQLALPFLSVAVVLGVLVGLVFGDALAAGRAALAGVAGVFVALWIVGYVGTRRLVVRRLEMRYPDLPASLDGFVVAQLSDLHVGPHTSARFMRRAAREVEAARPDLVAFTGDQVDDFDRDVHRFVELFGGLRATRGVFAIVGNHDVYAGWDGVRAGMEAAGMRVLVNESVRVGDLHVVGTGDPAGLQSFGPPRPDLAPDVERAMRDVPAGAFVLALAHNPVSWPALARRGAHLTLSGHTHHGQFSLPFLGWCLASPFVAHAMGEHHDAGRRLYVSPGTGYWGIPMRIGAWPEVTLVTLRRAA